MIGMRFVKYKEQIVNLRTTLQRHFNTAMSEISAGLPDITATKADGKDYAFVTLYANAERAAKVVNSTH